MSRCYPFPPPGYIVRDESLIESVKGTKEGAKRDRKHKKDKKRKERDNESAHRSKKHRHHKRRRKDASKKVDDGRGLVTGDELECLEKSCLTVELEHQTSSQNSCDSSRPNNIQSPLLLDGRQYGSGEFVCLLVVVGSVLLHVMMTLFLQIIGFEETSIRILLHGKEHEHQDPEVMITNEDLSESLAHASANEAPLDPLMVCQEKRRGEFSTKLSREKKTVLPESDRQIRTPLSKAKQSSSHSHQETVKASKLCSKCSSSTAVRFLNLIENWSPDLVKSKLTDSEDQELWFMNVGAKSHHHQVSNQININGRSSMVWPTARFLPEAELHALPFTVPF